MQYGYWKVLVIRKHQTPASLRHLVPGAFVGCMCLLPVLGLFWPPALWAAISLALLYSVAALAASLVTAARSQLILLPVLPVVIWCFQFGYGYGFLRGVLDFVILHKAPDAQFVRLTRKHRPKPGAVQS
jgi:hypothetical protein